MAAPPNNPLKIKGFKMSYFMYLCSLVLPYLKEENIHLDFTGYNDTIEKYKCLEIEDLRGAWELAKELNAWSEYFSDIANVVQKIFLDSDVEQNEIHALTSLSGDADRVSNGNRIASKEKDVIQAKLKKNILKSFYDELESKIKFLERGYYHCKTTYEIGTKTFYPLKTGVE